ncbi:MAG: PA14 domain-containing protein, partial [bacterium]
EKGKSDPRDQPDAFATRLKEKPLVEMTADRLEFAGYKFAEGVPADYFATIAEGKFTISPGDYVLEVTTDDGCRVYLDDKLILTDAWKYQGPTAYKMDVRLGGAHRIRVEHFQIDGYATLKVNLRRK